MYNSEIDFVDEVDLGLMEFDDPATDVEVELFGEAEMSEDNWDDPVSELFFEQEDFIEPDELSEWDDDPLSKIADEINNDVFAMNESEAMDYIENRMPEFIPALMNAIPAIVQLAPKAISAVKSIVKKDPPKPGPAPVAPTPPPVPITTAPVTPPVAPPVTTGTAIPVAPPPNAPLNMNDPAVMQMFRVFMDLIQSPQVLQLLSGLGNPNATNVTAPTNTTNPTAPNDQPVNGSNVLGVISSLAGALAAPAPTESVFPEYVIGNDGTFRIDPHNVVQEAELILDILN